MSLKKCWNKSLEKRPPKKNKRGGGGRPQSLHLIKSNFSQINKKSKKNFKKFTLRGGGGGAKPIWKKFAFWLFFWTLPLLKTNWKKWVHSKKCSNKWGY